uniref:SFRICE_033967 n=1 Tax=Spodoptera frugiperda TaxID=7108 RepID=A0A2H1VGH4_SPOFR
MGGADRLPSGKPVLVLANKQDKTGALDDIDVVDKLNIEPLVNKYRCPTLVESYSAFTEHPNTKKPKIDPGLRKGYQWLLNYIVRRYGDINLRVQTDIHADLERRKRMLNKASNTTSQTFTAESDEIATQTGFENPNYDLEKSTKINNDGVQGVIVVKPIKHTSDSIDSTITIESVEESEATSVAKPKLSPLFGRASNSTVETVRIELEPRSEFRKLSPIVRNKSGANQHIDFQNRPQSSPTFVKKHIKVQPSSKNTSLQDEDLKPDGDLTAYMGDRNRTWDGSEKKNTVLVNDAELSLMHREIVLNERDYTSKTAYSEVTLQPATLPLSPRPASASQLVRRQLELCGQHKRRLSLRYMQRNKTSPERVSMMIYEPTKAAQRHLDKGDFDHSATIN